MVFIWFKVTTFLNPWTFLPSRCPPRSPCTLNADQGPKLSRSPRDVLSGCLTSLGWSIIFPDSVQSRPCLFDEGKKKNIWVIVATGNAPTSQATKVTIPRVEHFHAYRPVDFGALRVLEKHHPDLIRDLKRAAIYPWVFRRKAEGLNPVYRKKVLLK